MFYRAVSFQNIDSKLLCFTPGIRLEANKDDQKRTLTAKEAINEGSDYLILGGYGIFIWPAFIFTYACCLYLYFKTEKDIKPRG